MMDMEDIENDYSVLLDDPEPQQEPIRTDDRPKETGPAAREPESRVPWWSLEYYQRFFNVTTKDVVDRLNAAVTPLSSEYFQSNLLQENPDLYGPYWICTTLAIETGLSSYAAYYHQNYGHRSWRQTVRTVYQASVLLFLYCWCLPTMLWIGLERSPLSTYKFRLPELWCVFGYATSILIPAAAFWALPVIWLRWLVTNLALFVSGIFICGYLRKALCQLQRSSYYTAQALFFLVNYIVGCSFVILFFPREFHVDGGAQILDDKSTDLVMVSTVHLATRSMKFHSHNVTNDASRFKTNTSSF